MRMECKQFLDVVCKAAMTYGILGRKRCTKYFSATYVHISKWFQQTTTTQGQKSKSS